MFYQNYIKNYNLQFIKGKFIGIFILNVTDILFTLYLLSTGLFYEGNPVMSRVTENISASLFLKIVIPLTLIIYIYIRMKKATEKQLFYANIIINGCLGFYLMINLLHIVWIMMYLQA
jgi:hypothetical protein